MKRVQCAALNQTIHFQLRDDLPHEEASAYLQAEYAAYKQNLEQRGVRYKILEETVMEDGSVLIKIKKQHGVYDVGHYLDN